MKPRNIISVIFGLILALWFAAPVTQASERDQATQLTFDQPVQIPGNMVLPAGTYWFVLENSDADRNIVQIYDSNWMPIRTALANAAEISEPSDNTLLTFAQRSPDQPVALLKWFYPGNTIGHEFVYSGPEGLALAEQTLNTVTVVAEPTSQVPAYNGSNSRY